MNEEIRRISLTEEFYTKERCYINELSNCGAEIRMFRLPSPALSRVYRRDGVGLRVLPNAMLCFKVQAGSGGSWRFTAAKSQSG